MTLTISRELDIPEMEFCDYAKEELDWMRERVPDVVRGSQIWVGRDSGEPFFCCGVFSRTLVGSRDFWLLLGRGIRPRHLRVERPPIRRCRTLVEDGHARNERFARYFGFRPLDEFTEFRDRTWRYYEVG